MLCTLQKCYTAALQSLAERTVFLSDVLSKAAKKKAILDLDKPPTNSLSLFLSSIDPQWFFQWQEFEF